MLICKLERLGDDIDIVGCDFAQHLFGDDRRLEWEWVDSINISFGDDRRLEWEWVDSINISFGDDRRLEWEWVDIINIRSDGTSRRGL
jgi:hypothetical protein